MKTVLITGGGSGLGLSLAKAYSRKNYHIIIVGRNEEKLQQAAQAITNCRYILCDITKQADRNRLIQALDKAPLDLLINNAGMGYFGPLTQLNEQELDTMFDVNVKGTILLTRDLLPFIQKQIMNIISTAGLKGKVNESAYVASKFAIRGFTESLQRELDIQVTGVYMGGMATPFWDQNDHIKDKSRLQSPDQVAEAIIHLNDGRDQIIIEKDQ